MPPVFLTLDEVAPFAAFPRRRYLSHYATSPFLLLSGKTSRNDGFIPASRAMRNPERVSHVSTLCDLSSSKSILDFISLLKNRLLTA